MADTTTTNLLLTKPEVGASTDTWGSKINTDLDSVDAVFAAAGTGTSVGLNVGSGKTLKVAGTTDFSANLTFTGTGNRITGDFSNATLANRVMFQTSTVNGQTDVHAIPNGTGTRAGFLAYNNSDIASSTANTQLLQLSTETRLVAGGSSPLPMTFHTGGSERVRIDTSGNVGIGTSSPGAKLTVFSGSSPNIATLQIGYSGSNNYYDANLHSFRNGSQTEVARIESGNLLVGTTSSTNTSGKGVKIRNDSLAGVVTCTADSSTDVSTYHYYNVNATNNGYRFYVNINGGISNYSANNTNLSDERTKTNIQNAGSYLAKICAIPVRTFKYKDQSDDLLNLGVIAQEVEAVAPELVDVSGFGDTPEDGVPLKSIYQTDLQYALMKCIQEQQALITTLTDRITALEAK